MGDYKKLDDTRLFFLYEVIKNKMYNLHIYKISTKQIDTR